MSLVVKATQRTLTGANGGTTKVVNLDETQCYICGWEMKNPTDLTRDKEKIWVLFEGDRAKWFCDSYP